MSEKHPRSPGVLKQSGMIAVSVAVGWLLGRNPGGSSGRADSSASGAAGQAGTLAVGKEASGGSGKPESAAAAGKTSAGANRVTEARNALVLASVSRRQRAFSAFLESMTAEEAPQIERLFTRMDRSGATFQDDRTFEAFMERWGELDAQGAMKWLEENRGPTSNPGEMEWYRTRLFTAWAASEPEKALKWADEKGDPGVSREVFKGAVAALAQKDPARAWQLALERCGDDPRRGNEVMNVLAESAVRAGGTEGLDQWFQNMAAMTGDRESDGVIRLLAADAVALRMTHASREQGMEWITAQADKPWRSDGAIVRTARAMAASDPEKAAKWSAALPMGKDPSDPYPGVRQTVEMWAKTAPEEMARWVESNRTSPYRDSAVAGIVNYYVRAGDPEAARTWAETMQPGPVRQALASILWDPPQEK